MALCACALDSRLSCLRTTRGMGYSKQVGRQASFILAKRLESKMARILNFTVIDVETANPTRELKWSICQVGVAVVKSGEIVDNWSQLIDPQINASEWWWKNNETHGIRPADVRGEPSFRDVYPEIKGSVASGRIVSHTLSDEDVIRRACRRHRLPMLRNEWRDSCWALAKKVWPRRSSHSLPKIAPRLGIRYDSHDAGEDARAAAELVLLAAKKIGIKGVNDWLRGVPLPKSR